MNHSVIANSIGPIRDTKGDTSLGVMAIWLLQIVFGDTERTRLVRLVEIEADRDGRLETTAARPNEAYHRVPLPSVSEPILPDASPRVSVWNSSPFRIPLERTPPEPPIRELDTDRRDSRYRSAGRTIIPIRVLV